MFSVKRTISSLKDFLTHFSFALFSMATVLAGKIYRFLIYIP